MNRRHFIKSTSLIGLGLCTVPQWAFYDRPETLPYQELIGKGQPQLFGDSHQLRKPAHDAFLQLRAAALKSNIRIQTVSSYRSFAHQNRIWERKYKRHQSLGMRPEDNLQKIIEYSTIPGTSRHHWGTDIDLIDANVKQPNRVLQPQHFEGEGCFSKFKQWMDHHANAFGFYLVYTNRENRKGFKYEPWHYSYKPLSQLYLKTYKTYDLKTILTSEKLMGSSHFSDEFISNYYNQNILDINPELL